MAYYQYLDTARQNQSVHATKWCVDFSGDSLKVFKYSSWSQKAENLWVNHKCYTFYVFTLTNGAVGKVVHLHRNSKILQVVKELEEGPELLKADSLQTDKDNQALTVAHKACETQHEKIMKSDLKQTAAYVNTSSKDSATILTRHNLPPFILRAIL